VHQQVDSATPNVVLNNGPLLLNHVHVMDATQGMNRLPTDFQVVKRKQTSAQR